MKDLTPKPPKPCVKGVDTSMKDLTLKSCANFDHSKSHVVSAFITALTYVP